MHLDVPPPAPGVCGAFTAAAAAAARRTTKKSENERAKNGNATHAHSNMIMGISVIGLSCTLRFAFFFSLLGVKRKIRQKPRVTDESPGESSERVQAG